MPVRVFGTYESLSRHTKRLRFHPIRVVIGQPYLPAPPKDRKDKDIYARTAQEMLDKIALLK